MCVAPGNWRRGGVSPHVIVNISYQIYVIMLNNWRAN